LAADNLRGAEVVLADGQRVITGPQQEPELFWAIRGGSGNFGVVTSLRVQLHERRHMLAGSIVYPWSEAEPVLRRYAAFAATMPDELSVFVSMTSGPNGQPAITLVPLWNGDKLQGERAMDHLQALGKPQLAQLAQLRRFEHFRTPKWLRLLRPTPKGRHYSGIGGTGPAVILGGGWAGRSSFSFVSKRLRSGSGSV
jgi:hypothetical protein